MFSSVRRKCGTALTTTLGGLVLSILLAGPSITAAQAPPVEGIKVAPTPFPDLPPGVAIPQEISSQFFDGIGPDGMAIAPVRSGLDDVYYITDGNYHSMVVVHRDGDGIVLVDAPEPLPFADLSVGVPPYDIVGILETRFPGVPVTHMIYSHGHSDHIGGASKIKDRWPNVKIIAHKETKRLLARVADAKRPVPDSTFGDFRRLRIGGQRIELHYFGNTHQAGNTFIYLPRRKVLMAVDIIYPGWVPFRRLALSDDIRGWLKGHEAVLAFDFKTLVSGHLTILGDDDSGTPARQHARWAKQYNDEIAQSIEAGFLDPTTLFEAAGAIGGSGENPFAEKSKWALFSAFYESSAQRCTDALKYSTSDWKGRLAGEETFNFTNCEAYFVARRLGNVEAPGQLMFDKIRLRRKFRRDDDRRTHDDDDSDGGDDDDD